MKTCVVIFVISSCIYVNGYLRPAVRQRRDIGGSLDIVSNNVQPIHADVKPEITVTEQPCSTGNIPTQIEPGIVFQVTPPVTIFQQSLRKSLPTNPSRLDLVRSVSRLSTVIALAVAAVVELYPAVAYLFNTIYSSME